MTEEINSNQTPAADKQAGENKPIDDEQVGTSEPITTSEDKATEPEPKPARKKRLAPKLSRNMVDLIAYFSACGRCSYFLTGYRVIHGVENMETAVSNTKAGWLNLSWNHDMRDLLCKSYGIQLDVEFFQYDGCCPECGRHYTYQAGETADDTTILRMQIRNRRR